MKKILTFLFLILLLFMNNFLTADEIESQEMAKADMVKKGQSFGEPDKPNVMEPDAERIFAFADELNLSDEQMDKLRDLRKKSKREIEELRHQIKLSMMDIQDEISAEKPEKSKVDSAIEKISANQKQLMKIRIDQMFEVKKILTKEQFKKLLTLIEGKHFKLKFKKKN